VAAPDVSDVVIVLTTLAADADGAALARTLVEEGLAACVNVLPPMTSVYCWKGAVEQDREQQLIIKTAASRVTDLEVRLKALHPYDLPEFLILSTSGGSSEYLTWVRTSVT
jgi:periplasmic divalent cation tolerance protein